MSQTVIVTPTFKETMIVMSSFNSLFHDSFFLSNFETWSSLELFSRSCYEIENENFAIRYESVTLESMVKPNYHYNYNLSAEQFL